MKTIQHILTPTADQTPAVVGIPEIELSGLQWVKKFPGSDSIDDLDAEFKGKVKNFVEALRKAGASVVISATYRPPERAYLMRWCWEIARKLKKPSEVPKMTGVNIEWDHKSDAKSIASAKSMCAGFGIDGLLTKPALKSRHTEGNAIDMTIHWSGIIVIKNSSGIDVTIKTEPRTGMNGQLQDVGKSYGVIKFWMGASDKPHWSSDGK